VWSAPAEIATAPLTSDFVRTIKESCLERLTLFDEGYVRRATTGERHSSFWRLAICEEGRPSISAHRHHRDAKRSPACVCSC
jgi:hypothetical protein